MREIAETLAWEEQYVEKIVRRCIGRTTAIKAAQRKWTMNKSGKAGEKTFSLMAA